MSWSLWATLPLTHSLTHSPTHLSHRSTRPLARSLVCPAWIFQHHGCFFALNRAGESLQAHRAREARLQRGVSGQDSACSAVRLFLLLQGRRPHPVGPDAHDAPLPFLSSSCRGGPAVATLEFVRSVSLCRCWVLGECGKGWSPIVESVFFWFFFRGVSDLTCRLPSLSRRAAEDSAGRRPPEVCTEAENGSRQDVLLRASPDPVQVGRTRVPEDALV